MGIKPQSRFAQLAAALAITFIGAYPAHAGAPQSDGEVTRIDKDAGKLTIRHGELKNLDMGPMTMVFRAKDAGMLERVKVGEKIRFTAEKVSGALTVVELETVK